jgi:hypothetical protein
VTTIARPPKITKNFLFGVFAWLVSSQAILIGWLGHFPKTGKTISLAQTRRESDLQKKEKAMFRNFKVLLIVLALIVVAAGAYAFAATNTVPDSNTGYGASEVSGYTVSDIVYNYVVAAPTTLDSIAFTIVSDGLNAAKPVVKISTTAGVAAADFATSTCVVTGTTPNWTSTCTFGDPINVVDVVALNVLASSNQP